MTCHPISTLRGPGKSSLPNKSGRTTLFFFFAAMVLAKPAYADSGLPPARWANQQLPNPRQESDAKALMEEIRCLVCEGQSVADSDADLAGDMRHLIRTRIAAGERPDSIRNWLVARYGQWVSYHPLPSPLTWPLWIMPLLLAAAGAFLLRKRIRVRRAV